MDICCEINIDGQNQCGLNAVLFVHVYVTYNDHELVMGLCNDHKNFWDHLARSQRASVYTLSVDEYWIQKIIRM